MKRRRRWLLVFLLILLLGVAAARWYLQSSLLTEQVRSQLEQLIGTVRLGGIDAGFSATRLDGLELREGQDASDSQPWLSADRIATDVSLWAALRGDTTPRKLTITGATVILRFDEAGRLITQFPPINNGKATGAGSLPEIALLNSKVVFQKPGYADFVVTIPRGDLSTRNGQIVWSAAAEHDQWGQWAITGGANQNTQDFTLTLTSRGEVAVAQSMLAALPFVPAGVWHQVKLQGQATGEIALRFNLSQPALHYRIDLQTRQTRIEVPALTLTLNHGSGRTIIEDGLVTLQGVKAEAYGGALATEATLDFRGAASHFAFQSLTATGIDVTQLPAGWGWPRLIEGNFTGKAQLDVILDKGQPKIEAQGAAQLLNASIAGQPVAEPANLLLNRELDVDLRLEDADLATLLRGLGVTAPLETGGKVSLLLHGSIPIHDLGDRKKYRAAGKFASSRLSAGPVLFEQLQTDLALIAGKLELQGISGFLRATGLQSTDTVKGKLTGTAALDLVDSDTLSADLRLERAPAAMLARMLPPELKPVGLISADANFHVPLSRSHDPQAWQADARLTAEQLSLADVPLYEVDAECSLSNGVLRVCRLQACTEFGLVSANGTCALQSACPFQANVHVSDGELYKVPATLAPQVATLDIKGRGNIAAELSGTLSPPRLKARGTVDLNAVVVRKLPFQQVRFGWSLDGARLIATGLEALGPAGEVRGQLDVNLDPTQSSHVKLQVARLDLPAWLQAFGHANAGFQGKVDGALAVLLEGAPLGLNRVAKFDVDLTSRSVNIQGVALERVQGTALLDGDLLDYDLSGSSWGGYFSAKGRWPLMPNKTMIVNSGGKLELRGVLLSRLADAQPGFTLAELQGQADGFLVYQHGNDGKLTGKGRLEVLDLGLSSGQLLGDVRAEVHITASEVRLQDLTGDIGRGLLNGHVVLPLAGKRQGQFLLTLQNADAAELLGDWLPPGWVQGPLSLRWSGQFGRSGWGNGHVMLQRGKLYGIDVAECLVPFRWQWSTKQQRLAIDITDSQAQLANGRATGSATLVWNDAWQIKGHVNYLGLHLRSLFQELSGSVIGNGQTGRCEFSGDNVRSYADMKIVLDGQIKQMQAKSAPVIGQVAQALSLSGALVVQNGAYRCRIDKGLLRVQELALDMGKAQVFMDGTVSSAGHLQLDVTAATSGLLDAQFLKALGVGKAGSATPLGALSQARAYLSKRLLAAHVTGTVRQPVVQIRPAPILSEGALRFFMQGTQQ